jgi:hypothetical protein
MVPPKLHWQVEVVSTQGRPPTVTDTDAGVQGDPVAGTHGCGVSVPWAAAVAEATCGLPRLLHMPNVGILVCGTVLAAVATGAVAATAGTDTRRVVGTVPMEQVIVVPAVTI